MFEISVLKRIFIPKRNEVMGGWSKLCNGEFCDLYTSPSVIRMITSKRMEWAGHAAQMWGKKKNGYRLMLEKAEGKRPLRRLRCW
jgi:hypothetical protein